MLFEALLASTLSPVVVVFVFGLALTSRHVLSAGVSFGVSQLLIALSAASISLCCLAPSGLTSGFTLSILALTLVQALIPTSIAVAGRGLSRSSTYVLSLGVISTSGLALVCATTHVGLVIAFELMLFGALCLLRVTSKAERGVEALVEMYVWSVVGSFALVSSL